MHNVIKLCKDKRFIPSMRQTNGFYCNKVQKYYIGIALDTTFKLFFRKLTATRGEAEGYRGRKRGKGVVKEHV